MYFPVGWPRVIETPNVVTGAIKQIVCNRDREKVLFLILTENTLSIWFCKPCVLIVYQNRTLQSLDEFGYNTLAEWKPDSSMIVVATSKGHLLYYAVDAVTDQKGLYVQTDSPNSSLRRDSAELFIKEIIPALHLNLVSEISIWDGHITGIVCITLSELMISTTNNHVLRYKWDGTENRDYSLDLRRIPFCINQQVSKAIPVDEKGVYIHGMDYSPLVGGFSVVLNDGRAAFLTAPTYKFDPNQVQGIWAQGIEDATCTAMNHRFRLITFGLANSKCVVYYVDESTGGLELSHSCALRTKDFTGDPGTISEVHWSPDGCALVAAWTKGGFAMWSTFGAILMSTLSWDYGLTADIQRNNPLHVVSMQFSTEGYQLWVVNDDNSANLLQFDFVKSPTTNNPCMNYQNHMYLQGDDKLYINSADTLIKMLSEQRSAKSDGVFDELSTTFNTNLAEGRQWLVIQVPSTYSATNWPIRYSSLDIDGQNVVIAGRTGIAHYSIQTRRWHLFGNESQEKDFMVTGGLLWWKDYIVMGCYNIIDDGDELRFYPKDSKLDNKFLKSVKISAQIHLINILDDQLVTLGSDSHVCIWQLDYNHCLEVTKLQTIDVSALTVHPACVTSITLTCITSETGRGHQNISESIVLNVSGKLVMVQREFHNGDQYICSMPIVLASCVENIWIPIKRRPDKVHLTEALWLFCGSHGMRVWLPLSSRDGDKTHSFMSKRIMLPFHLKIYPLAILFEDAIILGAENDTVLYTSDKQSPFSLPFCVLQRTSQVYLHQILRQLISRNLGYHAWEIARSCMSLPYFPHSLELLLHEVLEEEATSKEPIPDAQLPSTIEFILEFPLYLQTVVQCARKTEIALWPYLFSAAGKPKDLFQECMTKNQLDIAASYLIILQNLETSTVSRQYATQLLNAALEQSKWELSKDLVRFLRAIDPNDTDSPRTSSILPSKLSIAPQSPPVSATADELSLILGQRMRSFSTTQPPKINDPKLSLPAISNNTRPLESPTRKKSVPEYRISSLPSHSSSSSEEFFIDVILQKHAKRLLLARRLRDLGYFAAHLDFHLVSWLQKERDYVARADDFISTLKQLHEDFSWCYPLPTKPIDEEEVLDLGSIKGHTINLNGCSQIGDSGYMSFQGLVATPLNAAESPVISETRSENVEGFGRNIGSSGHDKFTMVETSIAVDNSTHSRVIDVETATSRMSSHWADDRTVTSVNWIPSTQILEELSHHANDKGSQRSEVQLRYFLQLFMEAGCLEWALIISIMLRDVMAVIRTVNASKSIEQTGEDVSRLRQGLLLLDYWTHSECLGYKAFMIAIRNQLPILTAILESKLEQQKFAEQQKTFSTIIKKTTTSMLSHATSSNADINNISNNNNNSTDDIKSQVGRNSENFGEEKSLVTSSIKYNSYNSNIENDTGTQNRGCSIA